ncbi:hypothetical protein GY45DRAFT_1332115 [Cubamyces sp. BRFM 1775]|nr:hypothetical protein GY45DRAFT_1332115 [Cubamyces sp. BRFM 1775]
MALLQLDDDTLLHVLGILPVQSVLSLRRTCKRLELLTRQRIVWQAVCHDQVLSEGFPFPHRHAATASAAELERLVLHALRLGRFWLRPSVKPASSLEFQASSGTGVSHIRVLPGHGGRYVATVYKGIWSMISCWDIGDRTSSLGTAPPRKLADWSPKSAIFAGFVVNSDPDSEAAIATAVQTGGGQNSIELLSIVDRDSASPSFRSVCNIATSFKPIALKGDLIAFSDDAYETVVMNWRQNTLALLKGSQQPMDERFQYNRCLHIVFAHRSILVVRARSVELFPEPELQPAQGSFTTYDPVGFHTFGWIDGVSVILQSDSMRSRDVPAKPEHAPLSILLRTESDDPWASDVHKLEQFLLLPDPTFEGRSNSENPVSTGVVDELDPASSAPPAPASASPYVFPPVRAERTSPTVRGFLRCPDIVLGPCGTALWIQPRARTTAHLTGLDVHSSTAQVWDSFNPDYSHLDAPDDRSDAHRTLQQVRPAPSPRAPDREKTAETLCAAVFAGSLQWRHPELLQPHARKVWAQPKDNCNWTAFDYDEERGRVALGSSDGSVVVLDFV